VEGKKERISSPSHLRSPLTFQQWLRLCSRGPFLLDVDTLLHHLLSTSIVAGSCTSDLQSAVMVCTGVGEPGYVERQRVKRQTLRSSTRLVVDEKQMRRGDWLGSALWVFFSALTLLYSDGNDQRRGRVSNSSLGITTDSQNSRHLSPEVTGFLLEQWRKKQWGIG